MTEPTLADVDQAAMSQDLSAWTDRLRAARSQDVVDRMVHHAQQAIDEAMEADIDDEESAWSAGRCARSWLECLENASGPALDAFLIAVFERREEIGLTEPFLGFNLTDFTGYLMAKGSESVRGVLLADLPSLPSGMSMYAFLAMRWRLAPSEVLDRCRPLVEWSRSVETRPDDEATHQLNAHGWRQAFLGCLQATELKYYGERLFPPPATEEPRRLGPLDPRWQKLATDLIDEEP